MKLKLFQSYLKKEKIDIVHLTHEDPALAYFTQTIPSYGILTITPKIASFFITELDQKPTIKNIQTLIFNRDTKKKLQSSVHKTVGINKEKITVAQLTRLKKLYSKAKFVDVSKPLEDLRLSKTKEELALMKKACKITSDAFNKLVEELPKRTLKTELDVAIFVENYFIRNEAQVAFPTIVAFGKNAATPHHHTSSTKLNRGFLLIDFGAKYKNYCADMTRMIFLGKPKKEELDYYNLLLNAQESAIKSAKLNIPLNDLDKLTRKLLGKDEIHFIHSLGHGIGLEVHEAPSFQTGKVELNVPFTIEPGIYIKNKIGLRIEDTLVLTPKLTILTTASKKLPQIHQF